MAKKRGETVSIKFDVDNSALKETIDLIDELEKKLKLLGIKVTIQNEEDTKRRTIKGFRE